MKKRDIQTRVKHQILEDYLVRWSSIIINGWREPLRQFPAKFEARLVYVDCFAFEGRYTENGETVKGSPIIGIEAIDRAVEFSKTQIGFAPRSNVILFEYEKPKYDSLLLTLKDYGYAERVSTEPNFDTLRDGQIMAIYGNYHDYIEMCLKFSSRKYTQAFYFLDTYGAKGIPLQIVGRIIAQPHHDTVINFPYYDIGKKTGSVLKGTKEHELHISYIDEMYGTSIWQDGVELISQSGEFDLMEEGLVQFYLRTLQKQDPNLALKLIGLDFPDKERTIYYLILTTHDPTGALAMNEILDQARISEYDLRKQHRIMKYQDPGQLSMFSDADIDDPLRPTANEADATVVAQIIFELCKGEEITLRDVAKRMVDEPYYYEDIKAAMTALKKQKRVSYGKLANTQRMKFEKS